ncbi:MAG: hypothetical protein ACRCUT_12955, partial [Spirochaetota bacterium]
MKKIFYGCAAALFLIMIPAPHLSASLDDFKKNTEKEESRSSSSDYSDDDDGGASVCGEIIGEMIAEIIVAVWAEANIPVIYADYPYQREKFMFWDQRYCSGDDEDADGAEKPRVNLSEEERNGYGLSYFTVTAGYHRTSDGVNAETAGVRGKISSVIGPEIEYLHFHDGTGSLHFAKIGANVPLFQHDFLSCDIYGGGAVMEGILDRSGIFAGIYLMSVPIRPLVLRASLGVAAFDKI